MEDAFGGYFVVQDPETLQRFREAGAPAMPLTDRSALTRIFGRWRLHETPEAGPAFTRPVLITTGRQDSAVGYADAWRLLDRCPRATFAVLDRGGSCTSPRAGTLVIALMAEWLSRVRESRDAG